MTESNASVIVGGSGNILRFPAGKEDEVRKILAELSEQESVDILPIIGAAEHPYATIASAVNCTASAPACNCTQAWGSVAASWCPVHGHQGPSVSVR